MTGDNMIHQEIQHPLNLGLLHPLNLRNKLSIQEKTFLPGNRMHPNQRMHRINGILPHQPARQPRMRNHLG